MQRLDRIKDLNLPFYLSGRFEATITLQLTNFSTNSAAIGRTSS